MVGTWSFDDKWLVGSCAENPGQPRPQLQSPRNNCLLELAALPVWQQLNWCFSGGEHAAAFRIIHGPAIVGIDEATIPEFGPLIEIGNARCRHAEHGLCQPVDCTRRTDAGSKPRDLFP